MIRRILPVFMLLATTGVAYADMKDDLEDCDRYYEEANYKKAGAACDNAIKKYPTQVPAEAYGKRAAIYYVQKDYEGTLAFIRDKAKKVHPDAPIVLKYEALALWELDQKGDAITVAEKVAATAPETYEVQLILGEYYAPRDASKTATAYAGYLQSRPGSLEKQDIKPRIYLGFAYLGVAQTALGEHDGKSAKTNYGLAVTQFEILLRKHGKSNSAAVNANNGLCAGYTGLGKYDQAIAICEQIARDPAKIDKNGSVWFNLGKSYFEKKQLARARTAATEYTKVKPKEAKGYILMGDAYFEERNYQLALEKYLQAEQLLRADQAALKVGLAIKEGKTYRRLPTPDLAQAIAKLEGGLEANPNDFVLAVELGGAYLENKDDDKALATTDRLIEGKGWDKQSEGTRVTVLTVAAKALYNKKKLKDARDRFEAAYKLRPKDVNVKRGLIETINVQAYEKFQKQDYKDTLGLLKEAAAIDASVPTTNLNFAVLAIAQGDCAGGQNYLEKLEGAKGYELAYERLIARTYLCVDKPDRKKAAEHYAAADKEVKKLQNNLIQAEIYTEWAPLLMETNLDDAVAKLEDAVQFAAQEPKIRDAAKRNLAVALFKRGWRNYNKGKGSEARADFERANREPALLKGNEPLAFEFSLALATLENDPAEAAKMFKTLAGKGKQENYLKAPYSKVGATFFAAYANYRQSGVKAKQAAAKDFEKLSSGASGPFGDKIKDLLASAYEYIAYDSWKDGKGVGKNLTAAAKYAQAKDVKNRIAHNQAVQSMKSSNLQTFKDMGDNPPEALVNLGILYDQAGKPQDAYDAWVKAKSKGADGKDLEKWISAKKRIYGY